MFGGLGQALEIKAFRSVLFILTYLIPGERILCYFLKVIFDDQQLEIF